MIARTCQLFKGKDNAIQPLVVAGVLTRFREKALDPGPITLTRRENGLVLDLRRLKFG